MCVCTQLCLTLCDPLDYSQPGSSVHGIFQTRILEWVAISYSRGLPDPRIKSTSPALQVDSLPFEPSGKQRNSLVVQWLGLCIFTAEGLGSVPGQGNKIPQAMQCGQNIFLKSVVKNSNSRTDSSNSSNSNNDSVSR